MLPRILVHQIVLAVFGGISLVGNGLLVVLILHQHSRLLGHYRWLLLAFASVDIFISVFHAMAIPYGCVAFTWAAIHQPPEIGFVLNSIYCVLFYEPFVLLMFHFIYRMIAMINLNAIYNRPWQFALFFVTTNLILSAMIVFSNVILEENASEDFFGPDLLTAYDINLSARPSPNIILMNFVHSKARGGGVNWVTVKGIGNSGIIVSITFVVITFCAIRIKREIAFSENMSNYARMLHYKLFRALLVQFMVPFVLCFLPYLTIILAPLTGHRHGEIGNVFANLASVSPAVDAFVVMFLVGRFRLILKNWANKIFRTKFRQSPVQQLARSTSNN